MARNGWTSFCRIFVTRNSYFPAIVLAVLLNGALVVSRISADMTISSEMMMSSSFDTNSVITRTTIAPTTTNTAASKNVLTTLTNRTFHDLVLTTSSNNLIVTENLSEISANTVAPKNLRSSEGVSSVEETTSAEVIEGSPTEMMRTDSSVEDVTSHHVTTTIYSNRSSSLTNSPTANINAISFRTDELPSSIIMSDRTSSSEEVIQTETWIDWSASSEGGFSTERETVEVSLTREESYTVTPNLRSSEETVSIPEVETTSGRTISSSFEATAPSGSGEFEENGMNGRDSYSSYSGETLIPSTGITENSKTTASNGSVIFMSIGSTVILTGSSTMAEVLTGSLTTAKVLSESTLTTPTLSTVSAISQVQSNVSLQSQSTNAVQFPVETSITTAKNSTSVTKSVSGSVDVTSTPSSSSTSSSSSSSSNDSFNGTTLAAPLVADPAAQSSGLSSGSIAAIVVCSIIGGFAILVALAIFLYRRSHGYAPVTYTRQAGDKFPSLRDIFRRRSLYTISPRSSTEYELNHTENANYQY